MKIVHLSEYYIDNWNYQENYLPAYQAKLGHDVTLLASIRYPSFLEGQIYSGDKVYFHNGVKIVRYKLINHFIHFLIPGLVNMIEAENPDLLFIHGFHLLKCKKLRKIISENPKYRVSMDSHADYFSSGFCSESKLKRYKAHFAYTLIYRKLLRGVFNYIHKFYCISPASEVFAHEILQIPKSKIILLPLGVALEEIPYDKKQTIRSDIRIKYKIPLDAILYITVGKHDKEKRTIFLTKVFNQISDSKVYLIIAGSIKEEIRSDLQREMNYSKRILLTGWIDSQEIIKLMLASDVAVFPGTQSVLWQHALGCGLPAIYKYWPGLEYLSIGNAFFLHTSDEMELEKYLRFFICNQVEKKKMGELARKLCNEKFDYIKIAETSIN